MFADPVCNPGSGIRAVAMGTSWIQHFEDSWVGRKVREGDVRGGRGGPGGGSPWFFGGGLVLEVARGQWERELAVSQGCPKNCHRPGGLKQQRLILSQF